MLRRAKRALLTRLYRELEAVREKQVLSGLRRCGANVHISSPSKLINPQCISVGDHVKLGPYSQLVAITEYPGNWLRPPGVDVEIKTFQPSIVIGNNVTSNSMLQVFAQGRVSIEDNVGFGPNVFINDASHGLGSVNVAFKYQPLSGPYPITIGKGCWIGANVVIMPGVNIGMYSVIGANSVVTKNIPAYSIAVGAPAKVIKQWNMEAQTWKRFAHSASHANDRCASEIK
ncbi:acyltransferase [Vreelandella nanhaiensis]|uniref:Acyltransferase n=2 Tax=Vreelandella nanhaiensis TaxID=1258546 RepID=A0A433KSK3_9GAMM|nr:acyltransferase [Halomonas nanhaiensis]